SPDTVLRLVDVEPASARRQGGADDNPERETKHGRSLPKEPKPSAWAGRIFCENQKPGGSQPMSDEWKTKLSPQQYHVLREKGTERAFTGAFWNDHRNARYRCAGCGELLFDSDDKFDSGSGWPSFTQPAMPEAVATEVDSSHFMTRTEVHCPKCGGHLGH